MKLSRRYSRVNLLTSLIILLISGIAYYVVIRYILTKDLDKDLVVEEQEIVEYINLYGHLPYPGNFKDQIVRYYSGHAVPARQFSDTEYNNPKERGKEPGRKLITSVRLNNKPVIVEIIKSRVESEDLIRIIFLITLVIIILLLTCLALANRFVLNSLWKPFYVTLAELRDFNIADKQDIKQQDTKIDEFVELNKAAKALTSKVKKDYSELKTFTDNTSHELMTPLAVIHSKLDTLLQTGPFTPAQGELLEDIYHGTNRLTRLNQSMLLMAKIENNLIHDKDTIALHSLIRQKTKHFQELIQSGGISLEMDLNEKELLVSRYLVDILLNNLLSNAIRHNKTGGMIKISLDNISLSISNTGKHQELVPEKIFERFSKDNASDGMGLGLSISRQISNHYSFRLLYEYNNGWHKFIVVF